MTHCLNRSFGEYGESSEKNLSLKSDVYVLAVGVESYRFDFNFLYHLDTFHLVA